jgi:tetratricopeptide (TPR) repeat protein
MIFRPKQGRRGNRGSPAGFPTVPEGHQNAAGASPAPRTHEFAPYASSPSQARVMADVELLLSRAETAADAGEAAHRLLEAAVILEGDGSQRHGADPDRAFVILALAFRRAPADRDVMTALERLAERMGRWDALLSFAAEVMLEVDEPSVLGQLWGHVARWSHRLGRWEKALEAGESALALAPDDEGALHVLEDVYRHLGHHGPLARLLARRARTLVAMDTPEGRGELLKIQLELAALYEDHLADDEQAIAASERAFNLDPGNIAALTRLERLAERHGRRMLLVDVLERRLGCAATPPDRVAAALRLAEAWDAVGRPDNACRLLGSILADGHEDPRVLRALAGLYRVGEATAFLAETLERLLATGPTRDEARAMTRELGELYARDLDRPDDARRHLIAVVAADPADAHAARLLAGLWRQRREWGPLGDLLLRAGRFAPASEDRLSFLREAVNVYATHIGDRATAMTAFAAIIAADPADSEALDELILEAVRRQDWGAMRALVTAALQRSGAALSPARTAELHGWLARAAEALADAAAALTHLRQAAALCPDEPEYVRALAQILFDQGHLAEALPHLEWMWEHHEATDSDAARAELAYRRGRAWQAHGNRPVARAAFQQANELVARHVGALEALGTLALEDGDAVEAARYKELLLRAVDEPVRRVAVSTELARLYRHELGDHARALAALDHGLAMVPGSHEILHEILDLQVEACAWRGSVDTLLALAQGAEGRARARYLATAARIADDRLQTHDEAAALFGRALDADPTDFDTFARLERLLTQRRAFDAQAQAYRTMITRVQHQDGPMVAAARRALWRGLGEIYRTRLRDPSAALSAFEAASALDPADAECRVIVTELCEIAGPDTWQRAVIDRRSLLSGASNVDEMAPHLRALFRLGLQMKQLDQAYRASEALAAIGLAMPEEGDFFAEHALPVRAPDHALTDERWHKLRHAGQDPRLSIAFSGVGRAMLVARGRAARAWGLRDESPTEREESERSILAQLVAELTTLLGAPQPQLRFRPDLPGTVDLAGVVARTRVVPTLVAGADMLQVRSRREILALVAKTATRLRSENLVLWPTVVPTPVELQVAVLALRRLCRQPPLTPLRRSDERLVARYAESLRRTLTREELERIAAVASELDPAAVGPWVRGAVLTAGRAGLLASGALGVTLQLVRLETFGPLTIAPFEQIRDLICYNVSEEHLSLRRDLGLPSLDEGAPPRDHASADASQRRLLW